MFSVFHSICCQHLLHSSFNAWHQRTFIISLMSGCHGSLHARLGRTLISEQIWVNGICSETVYEPGCFAHLPLTEYRLKDDVWATAHLACNQSVFHISAYVCGGLLMLGEGMMTALVSQLLQHVLGLINMVLKIFDMKNFWTPYQSKKHPDIIRCL